MPLGVVIRDALGYARGMEETRQILVAGNAKVDGVVRRNRGFPVGLMDVLSFGEDNYRVIIGRKGLEIRKIKAAEAGIKLLRVNDKTQIRGKKMQINFHDGRNLNSSGSFRTGDVAVYDIASGTIKETIRMEKGAAVLIIGGKSMGSVGKIEEIIVTRSSMPNQVVVSIDEKTIRLPKDYVFVLGRPEPAISLGEVIS
jgi:small subunit ribosomal protein S4e